MISLMGTYMQIIGQAWLVLELTHSAWQLGLVGALQSLPVLLFSIFAGVFADRWPKRRVLLWTRSAAMAQALLLWALIATSTVQLWQVYVLALLLGARRLDRGSRPVTVWVGDDRLQHPGAQQVVIEDQDRNLERSAGIGLDG